MRCEETFFQIYKRAPDGVSFCPYRISPLGAHIDHQYGKINGLAINHGIHIAYSPKHNGVVELKSLNFPKRAQFYINSIPGVKVGDGADHCRGAAKIFDLFAFLGAGGAHGGGIVLGADGHGLNAGRSLADGLAVQSAPVGLRLNK